MWKCTKEEVTRYFEIWDRSKKYPSSGWDDMIDHVNEISRYTTLLGNTALFVDVTRVLLAR